MNKLITIVLITSAFFVVLPSFDLLFAQEDTEFIIASWNLKRYSAGKASSEQHLEDIVNILIGSNYQGDGEPKRDYDLIFLQEIIVSDGNSIDILCNDLVEFNYICETSPEISGPGTNIETYAVIYKNEIEVKVYDTRDYDVSPTINQGQDYSNYEMVRPPMKAVVRIGEDFEFVVFNNHIKPKKVANETSDELYVLQNAIDYQPDPNTDEKIIVIGDLNAGYNYLKKPGLDIYSDLFKPKQGWYSIFFDSNHTTFAKKTKPYDRIIVTDDMYPYYARESGIIGTFSDGQPFGERNPPYRSDGYVISDHKLIWAKFNLPGSAAPIPPPPPLDWEEYDLGYAAMYGMAASVLASWYYISRRNG